MADELSALGGRRRGPLAKKKGGPQGQKKGDETSKAADDAAKKGKRQLPVREPAHDEQAMFDSLVGKPERKNDLGAFSSLLRSSRTSGGGGTGYNTRPRSSRVSDHDLISTMAARLRSLERQLHLANQACSEKDKTVGSLRRKIKQLQAEKALSDGMAADARAVTQELSRLQRQVHEMETFLADYGLVWVGAGSDEDEDYEGEEEMDSGGVSPKAPTPTRPQPPSDTKDATTQPTAPDTSMAQPSAEFKVDFDQVVRNVDELNLLAGDGAAKIERDGDTNMARLKHTQRVPLTLYSNGFLLFEGPFRSYDDGTAQMFMRDLMDGYFPWELKDRFPEGCPFDLVDKRTVEYKRPVIRGFPGVGMVLGGKQDHSRLIDEPKTQLVRDEAKPEAVHVGSQDDKAPGRAGGTEQLLSRLPPAVVVNGVVVDIRGAVQSHIGAADSTKKPGQRGGVELVGTPVATLLRQHADAITNGTAPPAERPHTPLDIATIQVRLVGSARRLMLKMRYRDTVADVRRQISKHDPSLTNFRLVRAYPKLFGNTCYCNSVLQALYFCKPFRHHVLQYRDSGFTADDGGKDGSRLLSELAALFHSIAHGKKKTGTISPKRFYQQLKAENELFRSNMQQDAQELLNFLLNTIAECVQRQETVVVKARSSKGRRGSSSPASTISSGTTRSAVSATSSSSSSSQENKTWVHDIFEGVLSSETRCLSCETVRTRDECFLDLSLDIDRDCSISSCLRSFSNTETLSADSKYFCETCCSKQEAQKRMRVKRMPNVLAIHLKRFKYVERMQQFTKLDHRVVFPKELRLFNATEAAEEEDRIYDLFAFVVHIGSRPSRGHYITIVRSNGNWVLFDDDIVDVMTDDELQLFFGRTATQCSYGQTHPLETAYILFYETRGLECGQALPPTALLRRHTHNATPTSADGDGGGGGGGGGGKRKGRRRLLSATPSAMSESGTAASAPPSPRKGSTVRS
ncbi:ubiquitin carboxyl-terminal hydrolase 12 [Salpingoeca rosetta]|uniref:UBX domain-containing protein 11 n=1 Tax=Salpingoeca rosetta (strain ATCC 50818 / BSB-021) TaxID=946362 RepID=F2U476_SALR5|nr:ubiquitin carboxyl-terminal hydrolase 12 [Salpingoeca rosetta]EGD82442.1 ubiquitin carboxyl-terminal hydrolase 12 [Salpingoeca rosetta]|eukprot:XP_004995678.1 ubiquitin carboxyl-terminal hydrolase 12 [Salpingoeca rosetta]